MSAVAERNAVITEDLSLQLTLHVSLGIMSADQFFDVCQANPNVHLERRSNGDIVIMPPTGTESGAMSLGVGAQLYIWNARSKTGKAFDSSTGYTLPNQAVVSPDASWISLTRWLTLPKAQRVKFAPICPDFVVELMSPSDTRSDTQAKMREYMDNGVRLGWLIDPKKKQVEIYEPGKEPVTLQNPTTVTGDPVLAGFVLDLTEIWMDD